MSQPEAQIATRDMSTETTAPAVTLPERLAAARTWSRARPRRTLLEEFEQVYLRNVDVLRGYFARRCGDPHTVADLTSETFVRAMDGFATFDPRRDRTGRGCSASPRMCSPDTAASRQAGGTRSRGSAATGRLTRTRSR